jgi:multiple sugar transport system permease protein
LKAAGLQRALGQRHGLVARRDQAGWLFVAPALLLLGAFFIYPIVKTLQFSVSEGSLIGELDYVGLDNFRNLLADADFYHSLWITFVYAAGSGLVTISLAFLIAFVLRQVGSLAPYLRSVFFYPVVLSTVIASVVFVSVFNPFSGVMRILPLPGSLATTNWLQSTTLVIPALIVFTTWKGLGFYLLIFIAGIANINQDHLDAAKVDGAGGFALARHIVIPMLRRLFIFAWVITIIYGFQNFALVFSLTRGGPNEASRILPIMIYEEAFRFFNMGYASSIAVVMAIVMAVVSLIAFLLWRGDREPV